jgi:hypothetical protein
MTNLSNATLEQLLAWHADIFDEIARRAGQPEASPQVAPPWEQVTRKAVPVDSHPMRPTRPEPRARPAIGAGEDGAGGGPMPLAAIPLIERKVHRPPGTVYATGSTDEDLARQFAAIPARQGSAVYQGGGGHTQPVDLSDS